MWDKDQQGKIRQEVGLVCTAPDGTEYEWDTTTRSTNCLSYVSLTITPRSEGASVLGPSQEVISQAPPSPISGAVDTSKLIRAVNRLLWAVVIIGLLVVLRAS